MARTKWSYILLIGMIMYESYSQSTTHAIVTMNSKHSLWGLVLGLRKLSEFLFVINRGLSILCNRVDYWLMTKRMKPSFFSFPLSCDYVMEVWNLQTLGMIPRFWSESNVLFPFIFFSKCRMCESLYETHSSSRTRGAGTLQLSKF